MKLLSALVACAAVLVAVLASRSSAPKVSPAHPAFQGLRALPDPPGWGYRDRQGKPARQAGQVDRAG